MEMLSPAESTITIQETVYKGKIRPWGKTRRSLATVPIPMRLSEELIAWKSRCSDASPEAFIFASQSGSFLDPANFRRRVLRKLERDLGLSKLTFQVIRRTTATLAQKMGTVKDVQGLLRHSRTATTTDVYMQEIPEGVRATVDSIHRELKSEGSSKLRKNTRGASVRKTLSAPTIEAEEQVETGVSRREGNRSGNECAKQRIRRKKFSRFATKCYQPNG